MFSSCPVLKVPLDARKSFESTRDFPGILVNLVCLSYGNHLSIIKVTRCFVNTNSSASAIAEKIFGTDIKPNGKTVSMYCLPRQDIPSEALSLEHFLYAGHGKRQQETES